MKHIKEIISGAVTSNSDSERELVQLCISIAEAYLRTKAKKHSFLINIASISIHDFAIDCVAELFDRRNQKLVVFEKWITENDLETLSNGKLFIKVRRLVFSKVNDHIFNSYKDYDPSLSKIIRNIKRGVKGQFAEGLQISGDSKFISFGSDKLADEEIPLEIFMMKISSRFKEISSTIDALQQLRDIFESMNGEYLCRIHITGFALILREFYIAIQDEEVPRFISAETNFLSGELKSLILLSVQKTKKELYASYVLKNKLSDGDFSGYFMIAQQLLQSDYEDNEHSGKSFYEHFIVFFPTIVKDEYRSSHRKFLEYFVKLSKENLIRLLKREYNSAKKLH